MVTLLRMVDSVQPTHTENVHQSLEFTFSTIKTASYHACHLSVLGEEGRQLHGLQQVAGCVEEGRSGWRVWRGKRVDLPGDNKQQ